MKYLIVGFKKISARSGTSSIGKPYSIPDGFLFECLRESKEPDCKGLITKQIKLSSDSPFWPVLQDSNLINYIGTVIDYEIMLNGKYESIINFEICKDYKLPFNLSFTNQIK